MKSDDIRIERLGVEAWRALKALRLEALRLEPAAFNSTYAESLTRPDEAWQERLGNPRCATFMARAGEWPVGMAVVCRGTDEGDARVAIVSSVYVNAGYRRQGVARRLLSAIIEHLRAHPEIATIRLWVSPSQQAARRLYDTIGFGVVVDPSRDDPAEIGDDRLILERPASRHEPR